MKLNINLALVALALLAPTVFAADDVVILSNETKCPEARETKPLYPVEALRMYKDGDVLLESSFDECGRALDVTVKKSSGRKDLDQAAVVASRQSVFSEVQRSKAVNGKIERKVTFTADKVTHYSKQVDWPKTHKNPRYVIDDQPIPFESVAVAKSAVKDSDVGALRPPVIELRHDFIQVKTREGRQFWLFLFGKSGEPVVAARYTPVMEAKQPIVKFAIKCELDQKACNDIQSMLMDGLPFARANKSKMANIGSDLIN